MNNHELCDGEIEDLTARVAELEAALQDWMDQDERSLAENCELAARIAELEADLTAKHYLPAWGHKECDSRIFELEDSFDKELQLRRAAEVRLAAVIAVVERDALDVGLFYIVDHQDVRKYMERTLNRVRAAATGDTP